MTLTKEQVSQAKAQLAQQIGHLPEQQKAEAQSQIDSMSDDAIEQLVKQSQASAPQGSIFRAIISGEIPSTKVTETEYALAVMDINPISEGHIIIIPKTAIATAEKLSKDIYKLGETLVKKITDTVKPKPNKIHLEAEVKFGEATLHVIPEYSGPVSLASPRSKADQSKLDTLAKKLFIPKEKKKLEVVKIKKKTAKKTPKSQIPKLKRRIA